VNRWSIVPLLAACMLTAHPAAQAGIIEDLLAMPAIQAWLGRVPELAPLVQRCDDVNYRQRNLELCQQAAQAAQLARMPPELRAVMASPPAAASLRELCVAAIGKPAYNGYLCTQLYQYDENFKALSQRIQFDNLMNRQLR